MTLTDFLGDRLTEDYVDAVRRARSNVLVEQLWSARALDEVNAKRRIVEMHREYMEDECYECSPRNNMTWPCRTLQALASVYSDHPDYRPEWTA